MQNKCGKINIGAEVEKVCTDVGNGPNAKESSDNDVREGGGQISNQQMVSIQRGAGPARSTIDQPNSLGEPGPRC
ncbi:unnamed protein product [Allacma fusca]|uniref:Uncharacterized protein n=1 Tax=Allacma fusca TaxID=39272 RepID=A0A8J2JCA1_9HEXA|nr:unnamed protein product [Allacma fusca]